MEDDNDILVEDDIVKAISFNGTISGTTAFFYQANLFGKRTLKKTNFKIRTGERETHKVCWRKDSVEVTKSLNVIVPEIIQLTKIQMHANNDLFVNVVSRIKSSKPAIWLKEGEHEEPVVAPTYDIFIKMHLI